MPDTTNGDGSALNFDRKLDRINETMASVAGLMHKRMKTAREGHQLFMEEVRGLIELQREQRVGVMALFEANKPIKAMLEKRL